MSDMADVSDFISKAGYGSESEGEDAGESRVTLHQDMGKGNIASKQSRVKLHEVGPRLELEVIKVEDGMGEGRVIFHKYVQKTKKEATDLETAKKERNRIREERRREQEKNVKLKQELEEAKAAAKAAKRGKKSDSKPERKSRQQMWWDKESGDAKAARKDKWADDDAEYFREAVGEEPDDVFKRSAAKKQQGGAAGNKRPNSGGDKKGAAASKKPRRT